MALSKHKHCKPYQTVLDILRKNGFKETGPVEFNPYFNEFTRYFLGTDQAIVNSIHMPELNGMTSKRQDVFTLGPSGFERPKSTLTTERAI